MNRTSFQGLFVVTGKNLVVDVRNSTMSEGVSANGVNSGFSTTGTIASSTFYMEVFAECNGTLTYENNIFYSSGDYGYAIMHGAPCTSTFDHNLAFPQDLPLGNGMLIGDPKFVDGPSGNYHLTAGSPAIDAANPASSEGIDLDGVSRPQGNARDMGAFEYH